MPFPYKYGKRAPVARPDTLQLKDFLSADALPAPETKRGWEYAVPDPTWAASMLGNDKYGDCVIAALLHVVMQTLAIAGTPVQFTEADALNLYSIITGFDPSKTDANGNNPTDQGTVITDALAYWKKTGINVGGKAHKIRAWAAFDYTNPTRMNQAIDIFGAALIGTAVVGSMEDQFAAGQPWNPPFSADVLGGHCVPICGFGRYGRTCITWAKRQPMDLTIANVLFDESYVVIDDAWLSNASKTPVLGLDLAALEKALSQIKA